MTSDAAYCKHASKSYSISSYEQYSIEGNIHKFCLTVNSIP